MQLLNLSSFQIDKGQFKRFSSDFERLIPLVISRLAILSPTAHLPIQHVKSAQMKTDGSVYDGMEHTEQTRVTDLARLSDGRYRVGVSGP